MAEENKTWWFGRFKIIILSNTHVILGNLNIFYEYLWLFYEVMFPVLPMILLLILMWFYLKGIEPEQYYLNLYIGTYIISRIFTDKISHLSYHVHQVNLFYF